MGIGKRIKEARARLGLTQEELASLLGITKGAIANYESGTSHPKEPIMYKLIEVLKVDANYLFQDMVSVPRKMNDVTFLEFEHVKKYRDLDPHGKEVVDCVMDIETARMQKESQTNATTPAGKVGVTNIVYFAEKVSAGHGWEFMDGEQHILSVHENDLTRKADYAVSVKGDSMLPMYADGDILLVREQPDVNIGEVGIFIAAGKAYVKKRGMHSLISINEGYPDISIPEGETAVCQGKVLGVLRPEWIAEMDME